MMMESGLGHNITGSGMAVLIVASHEVWQLGGGWWRSPLERVLIFLLLCRDPICVQNRERCLAQGQREGNVGQLSGPLGFDDLLVWGAKRRGHRNRSKAKLDTDA